MKLRQIISSLEQWAPPVLQENYDNSGLIVGHPDADIERAIVSLDCIEAVVDEAIDKKAGLVIAHHPIVFGGLKRFNGGDYVQRTVMKAIKHDIAIYAIHTNLDNVHTGVNAHLCQLLGIEADGALKPKVNTLEKLVVFAPHDQAEKVRSAMFEAGGGLISDYEECSFNLRGEGTFRPGEFTHPVIGEHGVRHTEPETRIEIIVHAHKADQVIRAMQAAHPYEEVAFDRYALLNTSDRIGSGMIGNLATDMLLIDFFDHVKEQLSCEVVRHTASGNPKVRRIAVCGGSGFFLLGAAKKKGADLFITSDVKYHQFFDAEDIILADIGHWESEHRTSELIVEYLTDKFPKFAVHLSQINTNPVKYY